MAFVACGLNHKTALLAVREKLALSPANQEVMLNHLISLPTIQEAAILSTCNRTEIYCDTEEPESIAPWLARQYEMSEDSLLPHLYVHNGYQGIRHTLRVASGLDSMMLGEAQIFGQMKRAYQHACRLGTIKTNLRRTFQYIFSASKRIRSHSGIGNNPVSVAYAAVQLIGQLFSDYKSLRIFIIGSGETATLVAKYLHKQGVKHFSIASRTTHHATELANLLNGVSLSIGDIPQHLSQADVVISATACPLPFINKSLVQHALDQRHHTPMFFLDLAVPRDIEPDVGELDGVHLYNIDDLQSITTRGMSERRSAASYAEQMIDNELNNYIRWHRSLASKKVICNYREQMQQLAQLELERAQKKLSAGHCQTEVLNEFSNRLVNKLTHHPSIGLRQAAEEGREDILDLAQYLFNTPLSHLSYEEIA